mgnify:CR=1 FL=1
MEGWDGVLEANGDVPACFQIPPIGYEDEDCLYINVYVPKVSRRAVVCGILILDFAGVAEGTRRRGGQGRHGVDLRGRVHVWEGQFRLLWARLFVGEGRDRGPFQLQDECLW